ncbi:hypothetical protein [Streptococcus chenjunshii]|uniref:hypothetical protein n=1 Tax=Streptococcus chenjunshii TaxID=2173853 RepID=UPI00216B5EEE|nr:hypothetical protein [Streptococcus chenjunshii]
MLEEYPYLVSLLWRVKKTKREWLEEAFLMSTKKKIIECVFIDEDGGNEHDREF